MSSLARLIPRKLRLNGDFAVSSLIKPELNAGHQRITVELRIGKAARFFQFSVLRFLLPFFLFFLSFFFVSILPLWLLCHGVQFTVFICSVAFNEYCNSRCSYPRSSRKWPGRDSFICGWISTDKEWKGKVGGSGGGKKKKEQKEARQRGWTEWWKRIRAEERPVQRVDGRLCDSRKKIFKTEKPARSGTINLHSFTWHLYGKAARETRAK